MWGRCVVLKKLYVHRPSFCGNFAAFAKLELAAYYLSSALATFFDKVGNVIRNAFNKLSDKTVYKVEPPEL